MKLISINIECNRHPETVLNFLKNEQPDVVCIQELLEEDLELYKKELGMECKFQPFNRIKSPLYPDLIGKPQGVAIFSKNIVESGSVFYVGGEHDLLKPFDEYMVDENARKAKAFVWADIKNGNGDIYRFVTAHPPVTNKGETTPWQLEVIDSLITKLGPFGEVVLCGDTNAPRGGEAFGLLAKKYKDNIPPEYKTSIDQNLHRVKGIQFMVDGLFTTPSYIASNVKLVDGVSDHMAIVAEISKS